MWLSYRWISKDPFHEFQPECHFQCRSTNLKRIGPRKKPCSDKMTISTFSAIRKD